jgi:hypothetical protein
MRFRALAAVLLAGALLAGGVGCGSSGQARDSEQAFRREFRVAFQEYRQFEPEKALALARGEDGRWAYGYARGHESQMQAVNAAEEQCERRRARYGVEANCQTYAVGSEITGDPSLVRDRAEE